MKHVFRSDGLQDNLLDIIGDIEVELPRGPTQIVKNEARLLSWLAENMYSEAGVIIDAGSGTGGSSHAICHGLARNKKISSPVNKLHCFDRFILDHESYRGFLVPDLPTIEMGDSFLPHYLVNMKEYLPYCLIHAGDLLGQIWDETPIEILFLDLAKSLKLFQKAVELFYLAMIPGQSILIHQDFERPNLHWIHTSIGYLLDEMRVSGEIVGSSLVLSVCSRISKKKIERIVRDDFTLEERLGFLDRALQAIPPIRCGSFDVSENYRLTRAYVHAHHGDFATAQQLANDCGRRDYFKAQRSYDWMIATVGREKTA
jgi:hypothetical protein